MQVVFERANYEPGETVHGAIYIRAMEDIDCRSVHLDFFGREECGRDGTEAEERTAEGEGGERRMVTRTFKMDVSKTDTY